MSNLVRLSLVEYSKIEGRYRLHDLMRLFAVARSKQKDDEKTYFEAQQRHSEYYRNIISSANELYKKGDRDFLEGLKLFDREWMNIQAGHDWAIAIIHGPETEKINLEKSYRETALILLNAYPGTPAYVLGLRLHSEDVIRWAIMALEAAKELNDNLMQGFHLVTLGVASMNLGKTAEAIEYYNEAMNIANKIGNKHLEGSALSKLGNAHRSLGNLDEALDHSMKALAISRNIGERQLEGSTLGSIGRIQIAQKEMQRAIECYNKRLDIACEMGNLREKEISLGHLGNVYNKIKKPKDSIKYFEQAMIIIHSINDKRGEASTLIGLGNAYRNLNDLDQAINYYSQASLVAHEIGDTRLERIARRAMTKLTSNKLQA